MGTPFVYGRIADKNNFTNRKKEVELLKRNCRTENKPYGMILLLPSENIWGDYYLLSHSQI